MPVKMYYEKDCPPKLGEKIAILGYGSQGRAHALNLKESGEDVTVGLYAGSRSRDRAEADGVKVADVAEAVAGATVVMILTPDTRQARLYRDAIEPGLEDGAMPKFAHGVPIHFGQ